jgi:hypothetical protein
MPFVNIADTDTLEDDILPPLLLGLKDTNPVLVAATLRSDIYVRLLVK